MRTWNHRLTFTPLDENHCRYTDEMETDDGWRGLATRLFIRLVFRYRQDMAHPHSGSRLTAYPRRISIDPWPVHDSTPQN